MSDRNIKKKIIIYNLQKWLNVSTSSALIIERHKNDKTRQNRMEFVKSLSLHMLRQQ